MREVVASGLSEPIDLAVTPEGWLVYAEARRGVFIRRAGQAVQAVFTPPHGEGIRLLALALDPQFERCRCIHLLMRAAPPGGRATYRIVKLPIDRVPSQALERIVLPALADDAAAPDDSIARGALRFGPDGLLYAALQGRVLRIDREGRAAHVTTDGAGSIVALGFHPGHEGLLLAQRRAGSPDELVWQALDPPQPAWRADTRDEGLVAVERLRGSMWGEWADGFALAFDRAQRLDVVKFGIDGRLVRAAQALRLPGVTFRALAQGPDGLYAATQGRAGGDEIWRVFAR